MKHPALLEIPQHHILTAFAAIMLGGSPLEPPQEAAEIAALAERLAEPRVDKRPGDVQSTRAFRSVYTLTRDNNRLPRAAGAATTRSGPRASLALEALLALRHRQRAGLALRHVFLLSPTGVARVLGVSLARSAEIVDAGKKRAANALGGRVDVARHLRSLGVLLRSNAGAAPEPTASSSEARPVFRLLLSAIGEAPAGHGWAAPAAPTPPRPVYEVRASILRDRPPPTPAPVAAKPSRRAGLVVAACIAALMFLGAFAPTALLRGGRVPVAAVPLGPVLRDRIQTAVAPAPSASFTAMVRPGDSLWSIAGRVLGSERRWGEIWRANAGRLMSDGTRFLDPDLIRPGWRLRLPPR